MPTFEGADVKVSDQFSLRDIDWAIAPGQQWALVGSNGSGKSALLATLAGEFKAAAGDVRDLPESPGVVSTFAQEALIERERLRDDSDVTDEVFEGTSLGEILDECVRDSPLQQSLIRVFNLEDKLERGFRKLSTGETRKALIIRALSSEPDCLLLDEPFEGLDVESVASFSELLDELAQRIPIVMVLNRFDDRPGFITHIGYMADGRLEHQVEVADQIAMDELKRLLHLKVADVDLPSADPGFQPPPLIANQPLVKLKQASVRFGDNEVFSNLDWQIDPGVHWQLTGPNGSGKTCLLNLITGDNPQCYVNDIFVFGYQRGQGESIWDIKQHIGYVSSALQWDYRVSVSLLNVIISGFYDSIGLYSRATDRQQDIARQWLGVLGMTARANDPFKEQSYGDQRLLLIARAMVKHPHLLILDEPCLGLDDINRQLVLALIERICADSESTVVYVNHHAQDRISGIDHFLALP